MSSQITNGDEESYATIGQRRSKKRSKEPKKEINNLTKHQEWVQNFSRAAHANKKHQAASQPAEKQTENALQENTKNHS